MNIDPHRTVNVVYKGSTGLAKDFARFVLRGRVVDLATAVVIGSVGGALINSFVKNIFTPLVGSIFGVQDRLGSASITLHNSKIYFGAFFNDALTFLLVVAAVYFFVIMPINSLTTSALLEAPPDPALRKCPACVSDIPKIARRCMYCTEDIEPIETETLHENSPSLT